MLPQAALRVADRLATALMALVEAVAPGVANPNLPEAAAQTLFFRLSDLIVRLIRISNFGVRTAAKPAPAQPAATEPPPKRPVARPTPTPGLPRRQGWLLAALPDIAPTVAADLHALLGDPALAALLDAAPHLRRTLRPLLHGLDLPAPPPSATPPSDSPPEPRPVPPHHPSPEPTRPAPIPATAAKSTLPTAAPPHALFVASS